MARLQTAQDFQPAHTERRRPSVGRIVGGISASLVGLVLSAFCLAIGNIMIHGLYSWQEPTLNRAVYLPMIGIAVSLPLGPLVASVRSDHRARWLVVAAVVSVLGVLVASLLTWVPVAAGWR